MPTRSASETEVAQVGENELREQLRRRCKHSNTRFIPEGITGMLGTIVCLDCGYERDWGAY